MRVNKVQKTYDVFLIVLFLMGISLPFLGGVLMSDKKWSEAEKRALVEFPQFPKNIKSLSSFFVSFEEYYNDHFGFREQMIFRYHREMEKRFGIAGSPLVLKGEGKWLYYTGNQMLEDFRGERNLSPRDLELWATEQQRRFQWLQERGISYLTFSPPNKQSIYPEFMPKETRQLRGQTRMDQLREYLVESPLPFYIGLYEELRAAKSERKLYFAMDSHWNHYGAYVAFKKIMAQVQTIFPDHQYTLDFPFHKHYRRTLGGDLARMLMIEKKKSESMPKIRPREYCGQAEPFGVVLSGLGENRHEVPVLKTCENASLRAIIFCDSFIEQIEPFLSENFSHVLYLRKSYDEKNILELMELFRPDIVIEQRVERNYFRQIVDEREVRDQNN